MGGFTTQELIKANSMEQTPEKESYPVEGLT